MPLCVRAMGGDFLVFIHLCALRRRGKLHPTGVRCVFTEHLLYVEHWLVSKVPSRAQLRAMKDEIVYCLGTGV